MTDNLETKEVAEVNEPTETTEEQQGKFYTEEEISLMLQKEGDKRISQYQKKLAKEQREADKLRNMSAEDKREYLLQQKEAELLEKESQLSMAENRSAAVDILADKGISTKLVDFVMDADAEAMYEKINVLEKAFKASVRNEVEKRLASKVPAKAIDSKMSKEQFNKLNYAERVELKVADPELYETLNRR